MLIAVFALVVVGFGSSSMATRPSKLVRRGYKLLEAGACSSFGRLECVA
jgi:hypothetical protein